MSLLISVAGIFIMGNAFVRTEAGLFFAGFLLFLAGIVGFF